MSLIIDLQLSAVTLVAAAGGTIRVLAEINGNALRSIGLDPALPADLSLECVPATRAGIPFIAPFVMTPVLGTLGRYWTGDIVIPGGAHAADDYNARVRVAANIEPSAAAVLAGAPAVIDNDDIAQCIAQFNLT